MKQGTRSLYPVEEFHLAIDDAERAMLARWSERDVFRRTLAEREGAPPFVFYEGPPTANGKPGVHHVLARTVKDLVCRYQTMRGRYVRRRGGWDTHGLPVELEVEKQLGISDKQAIVQDVGIGPFNERCRESVFTYLEEWRELTQRIAYWVDLDDEYVTLKNEYIESVWWVLRQMHDKGLLYRGFKTVPYSTKSGTTLSDHEVALGYREVEDPSVTVRFRLADDATTSFLVWTTTPWTLPGNAGLAVHPDVEYVKVRKDDETLILAKELAESVLHGEGEVVETVRGRDLVGTRYVPLFPFFEGLVDSNPNLFTVVDEEFVTTTDGTGIVHIAPAFGADDLEVGDRRGLPRILHVDDRGVLKETTGPFAGQWFKDADKPIIRDLRQRGLLFHAATYKHTYPFNWRGADPLMYVAREAWYVRTTELKQRLVDLNQQIHWIPDHVREGRFGNWLENNVDWALSRERFWGTPLPIWVSDRDTERFEVIGSVQELSERAGRPLTELDLHRPAVDEITWSDGEGGTMHRVPEVMDVWFDSGAMPFAQWHYPFEHRREAEEQFPADFICEGLDQTRGWFYSLHAIATLVKDSPAYKACFVTGLLVAEDGRKMSKSLGNTVDPWDAIDIGGADALRWFMAVTNNPSGTMRFSRDGVRDVSRKVLDTFKNLCLFFAQYANLDDYRPGAPPAAEDRALLDRWILSRLHTLIGQTIEFMDRYEVWRAGRLIEHFVMEDLSNWYVRRSRDRFWASGFETDKRVAYDTLYECLHTVSRLLAPFAPFLADRVFVSLTEHAPTAPASVHLADYPTADPSFVDTELEARMEDVRRVVRLGRAGRMRANVKTRQPIARVRIVPAAGGSPLGDLTSVVLEELNVKAAHYEAPGVTLADLRAKARFDVLGPRFGKAMKDAARAIQSLDTSQLAELERLGTFEIDLAGEKHAIHRDEVLIEHDDPEGWVLERESGWSVALDLAIDDDLRREGFAREIVNKIQFMRRKSGFAITDRIEVFVEGTDRLRDAIERFSSLIREETQADRLEFGAGEGEAREEWNINGEPAVLTVRRP